MTATLSDNARAFLAKSPALIANVLGYRFFEHPELGDESPLVVITPDGKKKRSPFWEAPDMHEVMSEYGLSMARG